MKESVKDGQTDRQQTVRKEGTQKGSLQSERQADLQSDRRQTACSQVRQTDRPVGTQTYSQTHRKTYRHTDIHGQTDRQTDRQTCNQRDLQTDTHKDIQTRRQSGRQRHANVTCTSYLVAARLKRDSSSVLTAYNTVNACSISSVHGILSLFLNGCSASRTLYINKQKGKIMKRKKYMNRLRSQEAKNTQTNKQTDKY